ncbi:MAG: ribonuclease P protein component [Candidatus Kapabacteria bacterium]|nr:ribonuclease P protein component [Ignavibacteriota bacterium]MCW5884995.1 ribonuclease P protein component [Candidatus Kapabacteria bacterium]
MLQVKPIKGFNSFSLIFNAGKKFYDKDLTAVFVHSDAEENNALIKNCNDDKTLYYGVTAGKKFIRKAVVRNRVKRLLRESIKKIFAERYIMLDKPPFKYAVFSWRKAPVHPALINLADVLPSLERVTKSAELYFSSEAESEK